MWSSSSLRTLVSSYSYISGSRAHQLLSLQARAGMPSNRRWRAVVAVCCGCGVLLGGVRAEDAGARQKGGRRQVFQRLDQATVPGSGILGTGTKVSSLLDLASPFGDDGDEDEYEDPDLLLAEELLSGEGRLDVMRRLVDNRDLEQLWGNPRAAHRLLQEAPVLRMLAGVGQVADKEEEDFTREDGLFVLGAIRRLAERGLQHMEDVVGQEGIVDKMQYYTQAASEGGDPVIRDLFERVEAGDVGATNELHDRVFDDLWGGVIDREAMGTSEQEPHITSTLRRIIMEEEPDVWDLLTQDDPSLKRLLEDPLAPVRAVYDLSGGGRTMHHRAGL